MKKSIVTMVISLSLCAADKQPLLSPAQSWTNFQTQDCSVRLSNIRDYESLSYHFRAGYSRYRFGVELTGKELQQVVSSWKGWALWVVASNWLPESFLGRLMVIETKDKSFLGTCRVQEEKHAPILALLESDKKYMNVGIGLEPLAKFYTKTSGKGYPVQVAETLIPMLFRNYPDVAGIVAACNENHPILTKPGKIEELNRIGFRRMGVADFPQGLTSLVPQKPVRMVTFLLKREQAEIQKDR